MKTKIVKELKASEQAKRTKQKAEQELNEFIEKIKLLCEEYNCRLEAQIILNSKGIAPQIIPMHNLLS